MLATLRGGLDAWLPLGLLLACLAGLRFAAWHGPVVLGEADIAWLLSLPAPRAALLRGYLLRGLAVGGVIGATGGVLLWLAGSAVLDVPLLPLIACTGDGALLAVGVAAASWAVECRPRLGGIVLRGSLAVVLLVAVGAAVAPSMPALGTLLRWSGPWGWAAAPVLAAAGLPVAGWLAAHTRHDGPSATSRVDHRAEQCGGVHLQLLRGGLRSASVSSACTARRARRAEAGTAASPPRLTCMFAGGHSASGCRLHNRLVVGSTPPQLGDRRTFAASGLSDADAASRGRWCT